MVKGYIMLVLLDNGYVFNNFSVDFQQILVAMLWRAFGVVSEAMAGEGGVDEGK